MALLAPHEFSVGGIGEAPEQGLSLLLPRSQYDLPILVAAGEKGKVGIFLNDPSNVDAIEWTEDDHQYFGILIPGVSIELDSSGIFDPRSGTAPLGSMIRVGTSLQVIAGFSGDRIGRRQRFMLLSDLPPSAEHESAGFRKWRVVIGSGDDKRELLKMDIPEISQQNR